MLRPEFVHLRVRSAYSLLDGAMPVKKIAEIAAAQKAPALAVCDLDNLFGALEVSEALSEKGIQPILGCALSVQARPPGPGAAGSADGVVALLAQNETG
jgi:DNA polymerase-3 subunit alpha